MKDRWGGSTSAEISQLFLIDLMYTEYYRRYFEKCSKNNEKTSSSVIENFTDQRLFLKKKEKKKNFLFQIDKKENSDI